MDFSDAKWFVFLMCAVCAWTGFFYKLRTVRRSQHDRAFMALLVAFACHGVTFVMALLTFSDSFDKFVGIPNFAVLCMHVFSTAFMGGVLVAIAYWTRPREQAVAQARRWIVATAIVEATLIALFVSAMADVQKRSSHYFVDNVHQPLVVAYLLAFATFGSIGTFEITRLGISFSSVANSLPWLKYGLRLTALGAAINFLYFMSRAMDVVGVHLGMDLNSWELVPIVLTGVGVPILYLGLTMPSWGPRVSAIPRSVSQYQTFRRLYPLWLAACETSPEITLIPPRPFLMDRILLSDLSFRINRMAIEIRDAQLALRDWFNPHVTTAAERLGEEHGLEGDDLRALVDASRFAVALRDKNSSAHPATPPEEHLESPALDSRSEEIRYLVKVAQAFQRSPIVDRIKQEIGPYDPAR
ncbi:MAB_1171c family putative transporter [Amycolatopsis nigrescens]|uniref:MAB_1171c family putative transporter n=1 Tax=Amycolatopsis nigrescens TaxID=381445 RepID=UPI0003730AA1|nr:MAB_1171c family putative transporter [Amycolatopsis nigrescens]